MSARKNDLLRVQEMYDVVTQTLVQLEELNITKDQFVSPRTTTDELIAEGFANRVLRVTEEGGGLPELFGGLRIRVARDERFAQPSCARLWNS